MSKITAPGIYDLTLAEYHDSEPCDGPSISSSGLRLVAECPAKYWWWSPLNPEREARKTPALSFGNAAHKWLLQGDGFFDEFAVLPEDHNARTKDGRAHKESLEAEGKTVLTHEEYETVKAMRDALMANEIAAASFANGQVEKTLAWKDTETGIWLRCRPDFLPNARQHIPDFKSCRSAKPEDFRRDLWNFGYHAQAALYLDGILAVTGTEPQSFYIVAQEKEPPYVVSCLAVSPIALEWGRLQNRRAIRRFAECLERDEWPGYVEDVAEIDLPGWAENELQRQHEQGAFDTAQAPLDAA